MYTLGSRPLLPPAHGSLLKASTPSRGSVLPRATITTASLMAAASPQEGALQSEAHWGAHGGCLPSQFSPTPQKSPTNQGYTSNWISPSQTDPPVFPM